MSKILKEYTRYRRMYLHQADRPGCGYEFDCDEQGNVDESKLCSAAVENLRKCQAGYGFDQGVQKYTGTYFVCGCGSGEVPYELKDGYGIYLTSACTRCEREKLKRFRPDIMERYDTDEQIEGDY
jgi:hypothetical protein